MSNPYPIATVSEIIAFIAKAIFDDRDNSYTKLKTLLTQKPNLPRTLYIKGQSLLHLAVINKNHGVMELLLEHDANVNEEDNQGKSPLHYAAEKENVKHYLPQPLANKSLLSFCPNTTGQTMSDSCPNAPGPN